MGSIKGIKFELNLYNEILIGIKQQDDNVSNFKTQITSVLKYLDDAFEGNGKAQKAAKKAIELEKELGTSNGSTENKLKEILVFERKLMGYRDAIDKLRK